MKKTYKKIAISPELQAHLAATDCHVDDKNNIRKWSVTGPFIVTLEENDTVEKLMARCGLYNKENK